METVKFFLRKFLFSLYEDEILLNEYKYIKGKDYNGSQCDKLMMQLLEKYNYIGNEYEIHSIESIYIPYLKIKSNFIGDEYVIDISKYKLDQIKKILSSDHDDIISKIEKIAFS